jgi:hypothetical protein
VLNRRAQIEAELAALQIERPVDETPKTVTQPVAPAPQPVIVQQPVKQPKDSVAYDPAQRTADRLVTAPKTTVTPPISQSVDTAGRRPIVTNKKQSATFVFDPSERHYAAVILNKVDPIFSGEAKNAFTRYNRERYYNQEIGMNTAVLDSANQLLLIGPFINAQEAMDYTLQVKKLAPTEIIPWLKQPKYSFIIIGEYNLPILQERKNLEAYRKFLETYLPSL